MAKVAQLQSEQKMDKPEDRDIPYKQQLILLSLLEQ